MIILRFISLSLFFLIPNAQAKLIENEISKLLLCYKKKIDAQELGQQKYNIAFSAYPKELLYKLFIDKERLKNPRNDEEKNAAPYLLFDIEEPGYFKAMSNAFSLLPKFISKKINLNLLVTLHDQAVHNVLNKGKNMEKGIAPGQFSYSINMGKLEERALDELFQSKVLYLPSRLISAISNRDIKIANALVARNTIIQNLFNIFKDNFLAESPLLKRTEITSGTSLTPIEEWALVQSNYFREEGLKDNIEPLIEHYYRQLNRITSLDGTLAAIAELLRAFEVAHFFPDGNQRTYAFLLLTKLLIENGIPPAILDDPLMFDGYKTVETMAKSIKQGIKNFLNENTPGQRDFLASQCHDVDFSKDEWLTNINNHEPYYSQKPPAVEMVIEKVKAFLKKKITEAIERGKTNERENNLYPLDLAIILNSKKLTEALLKHKASALGSIEKFNWSLYGYPLMYAAQLEDIEFVKILLQSISQDYLSKITGNILAEIIQKFSDTPNELLGDPKRLEKYLAIQDEIMRKFLPAVSERRNELKRFDILNKIKDSLRDWVIMGEHRTKLLEEIFGTNFIENP